ncbi:MAG: hypothetical protein PT944_06520 [Actinomycetaceae bacterium]|nr:hypothetical protein [Actinomycetaceae bacterium]MDY5273023.1 hypothetical protein [Arcanobacterium sp.]
MSDVAVLVADALITDCVAHYPELATPSDRDFDVYPWVETHGRVGVAGSGLFPFGEFLNQARDWERELTEGRSAFERSVCYESMLVRDENGNIMRRAGAVISDGDVSFIGVWVDAPVIDELIAASGQYSARDLVRICSVLISICGQCVRFDCRFIRLLRDLITFTRYLVSFMAVDDREEHSDSGDSDTDDFGGGHGSDSSEEASDE